MTQVHGEGGEPFARGSGGPALLSWQRAKRGVLPRARRRRPGFSPVSVCVTVPCSANVAGCWFSLRFSLLSPVAAEFRVVAPTLCCQPLSITVTTLPGCPWRRLLMGPSWLKKFNVIELRRRIKLPTPERDEC